MVKSSTKRYKNRNKNYKYALLFNDIFIYLLYIVIDN